jgi:predicted transcriptional regulator
MRLEGLHRTHLEILRFVYKAERTVSKIAKHIGKSMSWTSESVNHLIWMDLLEKRKEGLEVFVGRAKNELSQDLAILMFEAPMLDLSMVLDKASLTILPHLVDPGSTANEMTQRTGLSMPTIRNKIKKWRGMGVVVRQRDTKVYTMHQSQKELRTFIVGYSQWYNRRMLTAVLPEALIVWQWREEFLFSIEHRIDLPDYLSAGPTRLEELGYDILHLREYYFHGPYIDGVDQEEALVQSLMTDPNNPRMLRFIMEGIEDRGADPQAILAYGKKYGLETALDEVVSELG